MVCPCTPKRNDWERNCPSVANRRRITVDRNWIQLRRKGRSSMVVVGEIDMENVADRNSEKVNLKRSKGAWKKQLQSRKINFHEESTKAGWSHAYSLGKPYLKASFFTHNTAWILGMISLSVHLPSSQKGKGSGRL